jgi:hypothetical protein
MPQHALLIAQAALRSAIELSMLNPGVPRQSPRHHRAVPATSSRAIPGGEGFRFSSTACAQGVDLRRFHEA